MKVEDLIQDLEMTGSQASRALANLSSFDKTIGRVRIKKTLNLLKTIEDPENRRKKIIKITKKGTKLAEKLINAYQK